MPRRRQHTQKTAGADAAAGEAGAAGARGSAEKRHAGRTQPPYPAAFRSEAVRLAQGSGRPLVQVARNLGISQDTLRAWVKQAQVDSGERDGLTRDERAELAQLRRENRVLREEREILRKATAFFARESAAR